MQCMYCDQKSAEDFCSPRCEEGWKLFRSDRPGILRKAAASMRSERPQAFFGALAACLETLANREVLGLRSPGTMDLDQAVAVASAYLEEMR